jgi:hypothetical protein
LYDCQGTRLSRAVFQALVLAAVGWVQPARTASLSAVAAAAALVGASTARTTARVRRMRRIII